MASEIERKFLVEDLNVIQHAVSHNRIRQGYLNLDIDRTVRVRTVNDNSAWLTVKGRNSGPIRKEYEYEIPEQDGFEMLGMCVGGYVDKVRFNIPHDDLTIEVDVFSQDNLGLIVAEIEFSFDDPRHSMTTKKLKEVLPDWICEEVTDDPSYYNSSLIKNPYNTWST